MYAFRLMGPEMQFGQRLMRKHECDLQRLLHHEHTAEQERNTSRDQHILVMSGWESEVYYAVLKVLKRASLTKTPNAFWVVVDRINRTSEAMHNWWSYMSIPSQRGHLNSLEMEAPRVYARAVARLWRRVCHFLRWVARIQAWLPAFNEVAFRPEAVAVEHLAQRFKLVATTMQSVD